MKRLFLIGASELQLPGILKAKELGYHVAVADYNPNAVGIKYADEFYNVSTIDEKGIYEAAKDFHADGIITLATDQPMKSVAYAAEKLGLKGISYETALNATDKGRQREIFKEKNVSIPDFWIVNSIQQLTSNDININYPCICKPADSSGSKGVTLVENYKQLEDAFSISKKYSNSGNIIIEEFLIGDEFSIEILVIDGDIRILNVTDKVRTVGPYFVETAHSQPSLLDEDSLNSVKKLAIDAVKALNIDIGAAHVEIILTSKGPKVIEVGARMGGDCITTHLIPLSTGVDMMKAVLELSMGETPKFKIEKSKGSAIGFIEGTNGIIKKIEGIKNAKNIEGLVEVKVLCEVGNHVSELKCSNDRLGYVIGTASSVVEAQEICRKAIETINIEIEPK